MPYKFNKKIGISPKKNDPDSFELVFDEFYIWNIVRFMQKLIKYGTSISSTFNNEIVFKYEVVSVMKLI